MSTQLTQFLPNSLSAKTKQIDLSVTGMTCSSCVNTLEKSLNKIPGVRASINLAMESAHIIAPLDLNDSQLIQAIKSAGYGATVFKGEGESFEKSNRLGVRLLLTFLLTIPVIFLAMADSVNENIRRSIDTNSLLLIDNLNTFLAGRKLSFSFDYPIAPASAWLVLLLSAPVVLILAWPIHRAALKNIAHPTMDTLVSIGSLTALTWSIYSTATYSISDSTMLGMSPTESMAMPALQNYAEVSASVIFFVMLGRYLEHRAKRKAGSALAELFKLSSGEVEVQRNGVRINIQISEIEVGDVFIVKPGERIATDGVVTSGVSTINNSFLTGESIPLDVTVADFVYAGSINNNGSLVVRATRIGADTELSRITRMVLAAQSEKAPVQRLADRISSIFVPTVLLLSIGTFLAWYLTGTELSKSIATAIAVLIIACPCALGLATPIALMVAAGKGAKLGFIIRSPRAIEKAKNITDVVFDKTGTITTGAMKLHEMVVIESPLSKESSAISTQTLLNLVLSIESLDSHPVAAAISAELRRQGFAASEITEFEHRTGQGVAGRTPDGKPLLIGSPVSIARSTTEFHPQIKSAIDAGVARGNSIAVLAIDGIAYGVFEVGDSLKTDAVIAIDQLHKQKINTWLVTGDSATAAIAMGAAAGIPIDHIFAGASPEDKIEFVKSLKVGRGAKSNSAHKVLMIGDGINDAAAIAEADLSMAMGTGTDTAIAAADITLIRPSLTTATDALAISKRTVRIIKSNLGWAFAYNLICIPIAASGNLSPMYAGGAMSLSSLFVVLNSLRIAK
jgi:Cu+-exporting ATPase